MCSLFLCISVLVRVHSWYQHDSYVLLFTFCIIYLDWQMFCPFTAANGTTVTLLLWWMLPGFANFLVKASHRTLNKQHRSWFWNALETAAVGSTLYYIPNDVLVYLLIECGIVVPSQVVTSVDALLICTAFKGLYEVLIFILLWCYN